jgi:hypothetical protein
VSDVAIAFVVPPAGWHQSAFRRTVIEAIRDAVVQSAMAGRLDVAG